MVKNNQFISFVFISLIGLLFSNTINANTKLTASVDRNPAMVNESFILEVIANDSLDTNDLDLSPLRNSGLTLGRTSTSSQTQIINGNISKTTTWTIVLVGRQAGTYQIPPLTADGASTEAISVKVIKAGGNQGDNSSPIFVKNTLALENIYVQQTVKLITRLYLSPDVNLQAGTLSDPQLDQAIIKQQGKGKETSEIIMGKRYRVIERTYLITPQSSGDMIISSPAFNGEISTGRRSTFSSFAQTKPVSTIGEDLNITVLPIPNDFSGDWLPSELVQLNDEMQPEQATYEVGEPITRTYTLTAINVNEEQLPAVKGSYPTSFKVYPDKSETYSELRNYGVVSQRVHSEAIVATQVGTYQLPEVKLNWFNTVTQKVETAIVPSRTITVVADENANANTSALTNLPLNETPVEKVNACPETPAEPQLSCPELSQFSSPVNLLYATGWILWLLTLGLFVVKRKTSTASKATVEGPKSPINTFSLTTLQQACKNNDAQTTRSLLINWANSLNKGEFVTLSQVATIVPSNLKQQIMTLNANLYSQSPSNWDGAELLKAFKQMKNVGESSHNDDLPPLN